jgi:NAD(P)H-flavin reductase
LKIGDVLGIRGPFGNGFPYEEIMNKDILFIGGGIGLAPLRSLINHILYNRDKFKKITILHGARTPQFILYKDELTNWAKFKDVEVYTTVDRTDNQPWQGEVGLITIFFNKLKFNPKNTYAFVCGPLFMIQIVVEEYLLKLGFSEDNIFSTLERHMKCGVGHCGHCNVGPKYICIDGPVFTYRTMKILPKEF